MKHERDIRAKLTTRLGKPVLMLLKDDTLVAGKVDAISGEHVHVGWVSIPIHRVESVTVRAS